MLVLNYDIRVQSNIINELFVNIFSASPVYATVSEDFKHKQPASWILMFLLNAQGLKGGPVVIWFEYRVFDRLVN